MLAFNRASTEAVGEEGFRGILYGIPLSFWQL